MHNGDLRRLAEGLMTARERWIKSGSKLTFKAWCELEGLCTRW